MVLTAVLTACADRSAGSDPPSWPATPVRLEAAGRIEVVIPAATELAHVVLALADGGSRIGGSRRDTRYWSRVEDHFGPFRDHPLVRDLARDAGTPRWVGRYVSFRSGALHYRLTAGGLVPDSAYPAAGSPLSADLDLLSDFARASDFSAFYEANLSFFRQEIERYRRRVDLAGMVVWLEEKFGRGPEGLTVVLSPLIAGTHNTDRVEGPRGPTAVMWVPTADVDWARERGARGRAALERAVFTEIDHNFVNPFTDRYPERVDDAFHDLGAWNRGDYYPTPYRTFNEYMTWALFSLYLHDTYPSAVAEDFTEGMERMMVENRNFVRFREFNRELLRLYREGARDPAAFYEGALAWAEGGDRREGARGAGG